MPIKIKDVDNGFGNLILMSGIITEIEFAEAMHGHLSQDPDKFRKYLFSLTDLSEVTELDLSTSVIEKHSRACIHSAEINSEAIVAVVAPRDLEFGFSRMWEILCEEISWEIRVFRNKEEAEIWIRKRVKIKWGLSDLTIGSNGCH